MKKRSRCQEVKSLAEFKKHKSGKYGLYCWCRKCVSEKRSRPEELAKARKSSKIWRENNPEKAKAQFRRARQRRPDAFRKFFLKDTYGITLEQYNETFTKQEGKCAICGTHQSDLSRRLSVDHDHKTGKVRSLLCNFCNTAIGSFKESTDLLNKAIFYLNSYK